MLASSLAGCAANPAAGDDQGPRRQSNQITAEEIQAAQAQNLYDLIRSLRPNWVAPRGQQSLTNPTAGQVMVYLDGTRAGGPDILRQIRPTDVELVHYLGATEAASRFGLDHSGGAILVTTRRR